MVLRVEPRADRRECHSRRAIIDGAVLSWATLRRSATLGIASIETLFAGDSGRFESVSMCSPVSCHARGKLRKNSIAIRGVEHHEACVSTLAERCRRMFYCSLIIA